MAKPKKSKDKANAGASKRRALLTTTDTVATPQVQVWEEDPSNNDLIAVPVPNPAAGPLAFTFDRPAPRSTNNAPGTAEFRYWVAAASLRRGADFWQRVTALTQWHPGASLGVALDQGEQLNANYDRQRLNFYHGSNGAGGIVFSGESPDIVCHEMGHAILDAIKPQLWDTTSLEVAAFHESFGDISAILSAVQLPSLRTSILSDTGGHLSRSSRLSRLAEQVGAAIRAQYPDVADPDCLRNAVNSFSYSNPINLPSAAPASQLSAEAHSFSRVFTGAAFELLAALLAQKAGANPPTEAQLLAAGDELAQILIAAITNAAVVSNLYAQIASGMVTAAATIDPAYPALVKSVFVRRGILSLHSAAALQQFAVVANLTAPPAVAGQPAAQMALTALPADHYGLDAPLLVQAPAGPSPYLTMSMVAHDSATPTSSAKAAQAYVDDLFRAGRVDYGAYGDPEVRLVHHHRKASHRLMREGEGYRLYRNYFDCGLCAGRE